MDTNFHQNPNPNQEITNQQFDDSLHFEVSDYYTFEDGFEEDIFSKNMVIPAENIVNETSNSSRVANNMQVQTQP